MYSHNQFTPNIPLYIHTLTPSMADQVPNDPENGKRYANSDRHKSPWRRCRWCVS